MRHLGQSQLDYLGFHKPLIAPKTQSRVENWKDYAWSRVEIVMNQMKIQILGDGDCQQTAAGRIMNLKTGETFLYLGRDDDQHT